MQGGTDKVKNYMIPLSRYSTLNKRATFEEAINMNDSAREKGYRWVIS